MDCNWTGRSACVVGLFDAENNIAVVGKQQVRIGRNMQWLRIDTYFEGDLADRAAHFQPWPASTAENAPCEQVCPWAPRCTRPRGAQRDGFTTAAWATRILLE